MKHEQEDLTEDARGSAQSDPVDPLDDARLMQAVKEYLSLLEAGQAPRREEFLSRHPDLAGPLAQCLDGLDLVHKAAAEGSHDRTGKGDGEREGMLASAHLPANPLGDFQILREIGRGGMGVVYEAMQLSLGRRVALKVLPFAATFDAKHLQRFHNEAQAAAQLHHTNIVPVYAVGCERGVHFYAMQLIEGPSLAAMIRQLRQEAGRPEARSDEDSDALLEVPAEKIAFPPVPDSRPRTTAVALSTQRSRRDVGFFRTAARFMVQAADALEHAHQFGIVHRDIKPANLMVDAHGRVWITDFGLAQFHADNAGLTQTGDILGTLRYMSPEQASGHRVLLDHRTDVYSLGATLYELVTLEPIFPGQSRQELLHQIIQDEPRAPRSLEKTVPVELETIILKAVSKNPADRYASARQFGADLQRYLDDKPILARRPSLVERARKWSRRHPSFVVAAVLLLVFGLVGLAISNTMIAREQARTQKALQDEQKRAKEAHQRFALARRSTDEMIRLAEEEMADNPALQTLRRRLLEAALAYYQEFIELRRDDADAQLDLAQTRDRVKRILSDLAVLQGSRHIFMLRYPSVRDALGPNEEQRSQIVGLLDEFDKQCYEAGREFHKLAPQERQSRFLDLARSNETRLAAILKPTQFRRLRQVTLQCQGPMAFLFDPDVATALKLTAEQKKQIRGIEAAMFHDMPPPDRSGPKPGPPRRKGFDNKDKATMKQILALLTPEQTKDWRELIGEPFAGAGEIFCPPGAGSGFGPLPGPPPNGRFGMPPGPPPEDGGPDGGPKECKSP